MEAAKCSNNVFSKKMKKTSKNGLSLFAGQAVVALISLQPKDRVRGHPLFSDSSAV